MTTLHLLLKLKYRDLLKIAKDEEVSVKGKKRQIAKKLSDKLEPDKVREYFAKITGVSKELLGHELVPEHEIVDKKDVEKLLKDLRASQVNLPKVLDTDPAVLALKAKPGDVIRIKRKSPTAGWTYYYRVVVKHVT